MSSFSRSRPEPEQPEWSERFCLSRYCHAERWYVKADEDSPELWLLAESLDSSPWTVAAAEAICPFCGERLEAHIEGVGAIDAEPPAVLLSFLRGLDRVV